MKKVLLCICFAAMLAFTASSCNNDGSNKATEVSVPTATQKPTQSPTQAPTEEPTQPPTEEPTSEATQAIYNNEPATFSVHIDSIQTEPPTKAVSDFTGEPVIGSWKLDHYQQSNGQETQVKLSISYTFNSDGTFSMENSGNKATGTFTYSNDTIKYKADATGEEGVFNYNAVNDTLVDVDESGISAILVRDNKTSS